MLGRNPWPGDGSPNAPYKAEAREVAVERALRELALNNFLLRLCEY